MRHIKNDDFQLIQIGLDENLSLKDIASIVEKDDRAISRHIKKYRVFKPVFKNENSCFNCSSCDKKQICGKENCNGLCKYCSFKNCNEFCADYLGSPMCLNLVRFPYVCNGCENFKKCGNPKYLYTYEIAKRKTEENLVNARKHLYIPKVEIEKLNNVLKEEIKRGMSPEVILLNHPEINISLTTLYKLIDLKMINGVINLDLKRKTKFKIKPQKSNTIIEYNYLTNRTYDDFVAIIAKTSNISVWEIDTIEGRKGGKAIMSLLHRNTNFHLLFLIDEVNSNEIIRVFDYIKNEVGAALFKNTFRLILGDNGKEFKRPSAIEIDSNTGEKLTSYFYCESRQSQEKGKEKKNHTLIREIYPKGTSFDNLTQRDINELSLQINNYPRPIFNGSSPITIFSLISNKKILALNRLKKISYEEVRLTKK